MFSNFSKQIGGTTMNSTCSICSRPDCELINKALLEGNYTANEDVLESVCAKFDCDMDELKAHALFHVPEGSTDSLLRQMKLEEADALSAVTECYMRTLKSMCAKLEGVINDGESPMACSKMLTKPMVDLYLGTGMEIRQTVKAAVEIDRMLNGPQDPATAGLAALAAAIRGDN